MDANSVGTILVVGGILIGVLLYLKNRANNVASSIYREQDEILKKKQGDVVKDIDKLTNEMGHKVAEQKIATVTQIEDYYNDKKKP